MSDLTEVTQTLKLKPEALKAIEQIATARRAQGIPMDDAMILSGIINTYAAQMSEAIGVSDHATDQFLGG